VVYTTTSGAVIVATSLEIIVDVDGSERPLLLS
jgi:hypothetical protein